MAWISWNEAKKGLKTYQKLVRQMNDKKKLQLLKSRGKTSGFSRI